MYQVWAKTNQRFADLCARLGEFGHQMQTRAVMMAEGHKVLKISPMAREDAIVDGVGYASEAFVFSIATIVLIYEYAKADESASKKARVSAAKEANYKMYINGRFDEIDLKLANADESFQSVREDISRLKQEASTSKTKSSPPSRWVWS